MIYIFKKKLNFLPNTILLVSGKIEKRNYRIMRNLIKNLNIPKNKVIFYGSMAYGTPVIAFEGGPSKTVLDGEVG